MTAVPRDGGAAILAPLPPGKGGPARLGGGGARPDRGAVSARCRGAGHHGELRPRHQPDVRGAWPEGGRFANPFAVLRGARPGFVQMPLSYGAYARARMEFDTCILHAAPSTGRNMPRPGWRWSSRRWRWPGRAG